MSSLARTYPGALSLYHPALPMWEPLPLIVYGHAIHPLIPSRRETRHSTRNRLSTVTEASSTDDHSTMRDVVSLEVGDEVYAFEKYIPTGRDHVEGIWYRGCVAMSAFSYSFH